MRIVNEKWRGRWRRRSATVSRRSPKWIAILAILTEKMERKRKAMGNKTQNKKKKRSTCIFRLPNAHAACSFSNYIVVGVHETHEERKKKNIKYFILFGLNVSLPRSHTHTHHPRHRACGCCRAADDDPFRMHESVLFRIWRVVRTRHGALKVIITRCTEQQRKWFRSNLIVRAPFGRPLLRCCAPPYI